DSPAGNPGQANPDRPAPYLPAAPDTATWVAAGSPAPAPARGRPGSGARSTHDANAVNRRNRPRHAGTAAPGRTPVRVRSSAIHQERRPLAPVRYAHPDAPATPA